MTSKAEKARRAALVKGAADAKYAAALAAMPLPLNDLRALFDHLDHTFQQDSCDHSVRLTECFLSERGLDVERVTAWLQQYGGFCDCEVLANVTEFWGDETLRNQWAAEP